MLTGEGLGRLRSAPAEVLDLDLEALRTSARCWLEALQSDGEVPTLAPPVLRSTTAEAHGAHR